MDGMHRVVKALLLDLGTVPAVQFSETPKPDFVNVDAMQLPYPDEDL